MNKNQDAIIEILLLALREIAKASGCALTRGYAKGAIEYATNHIKEKQTMRTITIDINPDEFAELAKNTDPIDIHESIGYLATWGMTGTGFNKVQIRITDKRDLLAYYTDTANPDNRFTMGAVWRDEGKKYTFHS